MGGERPSDHIESMPGPLSEAAWSTDFVMQAIEVLPVSLRDGSLWAMTPEHADSFVLAWPAGAKPEEVAARAMVQLGLEATVLHSTSWRQADKEVVLAYIAVVPPDSDAPPSRSGAWRCDRAAVVHRGTPGAGARAAPPRLAQKGRSRDRRAAGRLGQCIIGLRTRTVPRVRRPARLSEPAYLMLESARS